MADYTESLTAEGVPFELLDADEIRRRWPQWRLDDGVTGMFQAQGGLADPNRGNAAHQRLARANGATLLDRTPVLAIRDAGGGELEVETADGVHRTGRVVLTADAWTNRLLASFDRELPLTVTKEQVTYFACPDPAAFAPDRFPVWIWMDVPSFYGFPTYGEAGPKVAEDCGGRAGGSGHPHVRPGRCCLRAGRVVHGGPPARRPRTAHLHQDVPVHADARIETSCSTGCPIIPGVVVALGAGHGFKYASVLGRVAAELSIDGASPSAGELEAFRIDRPILLEKDPPNAWMV